MTRPRFSIVTPVHRPPLDLLDACLASVAAQTFGDWELCLVDDGSADPAVAGRLRDAARRDGRVRVVTRTEAGGIVAASNAGLAMAAGEFVVLLDHDDQLEPRALEMVAAVIDAEPDIDYVYTDEDKRAPDGTAYDVFRKPDWSPERLRSQNYCTHLSVLRRSVVAAVGGFRDGYDGSQDHDLILRVSERARRIAHIPEVLYHWCITPGSAAGDAGAKPYAREAGRRAVADHLDRVGVDATVEQLATPGHYRVRRRRPDPPPTVSAIVLTAGRRRSVWGVDRTVVVDLIDSLRTVTEYPAIEVIVVVDPDTPPEVRDELAGRDVRIESPPAGGHGGGPRDTAVAAATGDLVLLLDDDVRIEQPDWLDVMVGLLLGEADVGVVGARLLAADGTLCHGGFLLDEPPLSIFQGFGGTDPGPFGLLEIDREVSAVTGACLLTRRTTWDEVGGWGPPGPAAFDDVDYCLRVRATGRRVVWTPHATLYHFGPPVDGVGDGAARLAARWASEIARDPYGNPHFARHQGCWVEADRASLRGVLTRRWRARRRVTSLEGPAE